MNKFPLVLVLVFSLSMFAACVPGPGEPTPQKIILPTLSPSPAAKHTPTTISTPFVTLTPTSTKITDDALSPVATNTFEATPTYQPTVVSALETMDAIVTSNPKAGQHYSWDCMLYPCYTTGLGLSPNGLWATFFVSRENDGGLLIATVNGETTYEVFHSDIAGETGGVNYLSVEHWSLDGKYVYLDLQCECDGGYFWFWKAGSDLVRLDLETGNWINTYMGAGFSFSPNDKYLAYKSGQGIHIHEFRTGKEKIFTPPQDFQNFGRMVWSPDSKKVVFIVSTEELSMDEHQDGFSAYMIDLQKNAVQLLYKNDTRYLYPVKWDDPKNITLESLFAQEYLHYIFTLETRQITPVPYPSQ